MCAGAIAWAGLKEVVYGTSIQRLIELGWPQIDIGSREVFKRAWRVGSKTEVVGSVLGEDMDGWFGWQFRGGVCPEGCRRRDGNCVPEG
jgi:tRNA(Arg) A34 adenosine deaminase TadA